MPAPIVLQDTSGLAEGIAGAGSAFAGALKYRAEKGQEAERQKKYQSVLNNTLGSLPPDASPVQIVSAFNQAVGSLPPDMAKAAFAAYQPMLEQGVKAERDRALLQDLGLLPKQPSVVGGGVMQPVAPGQEQPQGFQGQPGEQMPGVPQAPGQQQEAPEPIANWSEEKLVLAQASNVPALKSVADAEFKRRDLELKRDLSERDYQSKFATKIVEKESNLRKKVRDKELASVMARDAIESDEVGALSLSNLGRRLGIRELETARGAQLTQAAKINLVGNLADVSARAQNLWMEKMMSEAFALVGRDKNANLMAMELFDTEKDLNKAWLDVSDEVKQADRQKYGHVKWESLDERVSKEVVDRENEIMDKASFKTRQIFETSKGEQWMIENVNRKVPTGTYLTPKMAAAFQYVYKDPRTAVANAKKLGYRLPKDKERLRWQ